MRTFVIIDSEENFNYQDNILNYFNSDDYFYIFCKKSRSGNKVIDSENVKYVFVADEEVNNEPKMRNYISKYFLNENYKGFLYVFLSSLKFLKDPHDFFTSIEEMIKTLNLKSWFNCSCDPVNYIYTRFNPRFEIYIDDEEAKKKFSKNILMCSNANTELIIYDMEKSSYEDMRFDESFSIAMYYIIEFLSRRRNNKKFGEFNYMNLYPTLREELGVFEEDRNPPNKIKKTDEEQEKIFQEEGKIFSDMKINNSADYDVAQMTEDLRNILIA